MAITQLQTGPSVGGALGSALGTGLQALAQKKMQEVSQRNGLKALGYPEEQANQLAQLDPSFLQAIVKQNLANQGKAGSAAGNQGLLNALSALSGQEQSGFEKLQTQQPSELPQEQFPEIQEIAQQQQRFPMFPSQAISAAKTGLPTEQIMAPTQAEKRKILSQQELPKTEKQQEVKKSEQEAEKVIKPISLPPLKQLLSQPGLTNADKKLIFNEYKKQENQKKKEDALRVKDQLKEQQENQKISIAKQNKIDKETLPFYKDTLKAEQGAKQNLKRLEKMEEKARDGSLPIALFYKLFKNMQEYEFGKSVPFVGPLFGMIVNPIVQASGAILSEAQRSITSRDTEEYEKLQADFIRGAKDVFGARVTDKDLDFYMKMIPTLANTDRGKLTIIQNMREFQNLLIQRAEAMKKIIKENNGERPANLEILVDEMVSSDLDRSANEIKEVQYL